MTEDELTVTEVLALLGARGFTGDFHVATDPAGVVCGRCRHRVSPSDAEVVEIFRFEGASDPDDEAIVLALRCQTCGHEGTLVAAFGATADAAEADVVRDLADGRGKT
jgi:hypothetical protein